MARMFFAELDTVRPRLTMEVAESMYVGRPPLKLTHSLFLVLFIETASGSSELLTITSTLQF